MLTATGHSHNPVSSQAVEHVITQCQEGMKGVEPDLGIVFTSQMDGDFQLILDRIMDVWPGMQLIGCTTDGEISDLFPSTEDSLCLLVIQSDRITFATGYGDNVSGNPGDSVRQAMAMARGSSLEQPKIGLALVEGLRTLGVSLDDALRQVSEDKFPFFGGYAGDHFELRGTYQFHGRKVLNDAVVLALISGPLLYSSRMLTGYKPIGEMFEITRYKGNTIWEINGQPVLEFYRKLFGSHQDEYRQHPLAVHDEQDNFVLRDPATFNQDGSISYCGNFSGNRIRLTEFDRESLIRAAHQSTVQAFGAYPGKIPDWAFLVPCTSRRHYLGTLAAEEQTELVSYKSTFPQLSIFGMYAYGEIGPLSSGDTAYHNAAYALLLLGEE